MNNGLAIQQINKMNSALAEIATLHDALDFVDKAKAVKILLDAAGLGESAREVKVSQLRAERLAGRFIADMPKAAGKRTDLEPSNIMLPGDDSPTYSDLGITKMQASRWQQVASLPDEDFEKIVDSTKQSGRELTQSAVLRAARASTNEAKRATAPTLGARGVAPTFYNQSADDMPGVGSDTVNIIITSPPYNLGATVWPMGGEGRKPRADGIGYDDNRSEKEYQDWQVRCLEEWYRVAKPGASLFYNHKVRQKEGGIIHPMDWLRRSEWTVRQEIVWDRGSTHNHNASLFWQHDERIYWLTKGRPELPDRSIGAPTVWGFHGPIVDTWHPAPFSDELPERCLRAVGKVGDVILDPFGGSMTTCRVASSMGFASIGVDINSDYIERAKRENGWI